MIHLLDVNVLLALMDSRHIAHQTAHDWFERTGRNGFATCPITENAFLRIASSRAYVDEPLSIEGLMDALDDLRRELGHHFWAEDFSLLDKSLVAGELITRSAQVTDVYLLALAVRNKGKFATLDRKIKPRAVRGGEDALALINGQSR